MGHVVDAEHVFEAVVGGGGAADDGAGVEEEDVEFQVRVGGEQGGDGGVDGGEGGGVVGDEFERGSGDGGGGFADLAHGGVAFRRRAAGHEDFGAFTREDLGGYFADS